MKKARGSSPRLRGDRKMDQKKSYRNFRVATYVWAYYLDTVTDEQLQKDIDEILTYIPMEKVYLENHRATVDIPVERMRHFKEIFERNGIIVSGGITSTALVNGQKKPSIFDTFCYTDPAHRERYVELIEELASVFDEIILDDFFFTACRCKKCIAAKGSLSWSQYRLNMMADFSKVIVEKAKAVNPKMNFIIKYPAWYKGYQETGYNPQAQRNIFDMIYTGTETREPVYNMQHLQRYHSYSIMRFLTNVAPGKNGGGWIDAGGSGDNINRFLEQADQTMFAGAEELTIWNFEYMLHKEINVLPALGKELYRVDNLMDLAGKPLGVPVYEPFNSEGEDLLYNYIGMCGIAFEPTPDFPADAPVIFVTESSAHDPEIVEKLKEYVMNGGNVVMTTGFLKRTEDRGIHDLTCVKLSGKLVSGKEYMVANRNYAASYVEKSMEPVVFEALNTRDNAVWSDIAVLCREFNTPVMTEEDYGDGRVFILNVPQNPADFYRLPQKVLETMAKHMSMGQKVYISGDTKCSFFAYENNLYGVENFAPYAETVHVIVRGKPDGIQDAETGEIYDTVIPLPGPGKPNDAASFIPEEREYYIELKVRPGDYTFFKVL